LKPNKNVKALSHLAIIVLMITSLVVGALLSYLWVMGYYLTLGLQVPKDPALSIWNVDFTDQNTKYFNVTFFNPSYSKDATVTKIAVKTADNRLHNVTLPSPGTLYIPRASHTFDGKMTFNCTWDWANYTGQDIGVIAFVDEGSGPTHEVTTPFVGLNITEALFDSSISFTHFNLTLQNSQDSATYVNISQIIPSIGVTPLAQISPSLPYKLDKGKNKTFECTWNWKDYQNRSITIAVHTLQGYAAYYNKTTPQPLDVEITSVVFSEPHMTEFNVTVRNRKESPTSVTLNKITVDYGAVTEINGTVIKVNGTMVTPEPLPYELNQNSNVTLKCSWNWTLYREKIVTISIFTAQNYTISYAKTTPSPIEITGVIFDAVETSRFNVTVHNSAFYYASVLITNITVTLENGTVKVINGTTVTPQPFPYILNQSLSIPFRCLWNWIDYQGEKITITVEAAGDYRAQFVIITPKRVILTITSISFDTINTTIFEVIVRNNVTSLEDASITRITVTLENETEPVFSVSLSYLIIPDSTHTFTCHWDWTNYKGKNITITVYAAKGYVAFSLYTTPPE